MKKSRIIWLIAILGLAVLWGISNRFIKAKGYDGLLDFIPSLISNASNSKAAADTLYLNVKTDDWEKLSDIRDEALKRGIIVNPDDPWVKGKMVYQNDSLKVRLRLKGKMTDHVKGDKWSFRVKTKGGKLFKGMRRFTLQHPGTRNYLYEWIHQQLAIQEDIMSLNYSFLNLYINGKDLGIYALEENFDKELPFNNERKLGPVFRFDPDAFWEFRLLERQGIRLEPEYTKFQSSFIDPMRSYSLEDSAQASYLKEAILLMNAFREGRISAGEAFNLESFAKRYAILDLIGGHKSVDWSDLKFYYDPVTRKIEPIAYESFSLRPIHELVGSYRFKRSSDYKEDFHDLLFSDPQFFEMYLAELERMSTIAYLDDFFSRNDSAMQSNIAILNSEFPYKRFEEKLYYKNASYIRTLIAPKLGVQASIRGAQDEYLLSITNANALPVELIGIGISEEEYTPVTGIIDAKSRYGFPVQRSIEINITNINDDFKLIYKIPGSAKLMSCDLISDLSYEGVKMPTEARSILEAEFVLESGDSLLILPGKHSVKEDFFLPSGKILIAADGTRIDFENDAKIYCEGDVKFKAINENGIELRSAAFVSYGKDAFMNFENVLFKGGEAACILGQKINVELKNVVFRKIKDVCVELVNSELLADNSSFFSSKNAIKADFSSLEIKNCSFSDLSNNALSFDRSNAMISNSHFSHIKDKSINAEKWSVIEFKNSQVSNADQALVIRSGSKIKVRKTTLKENDLDISIKTKSGFGPSKAIFVDKAAIEGLSIEKDEESLIE